MIIGGNWYDHQIWLEIRLQSQGKPNKIKWSGKVMELETQNIYFLNADYRKMNKRCDFHLKMFVIIMFFIG